MFIFVYVPTVSEWSCACVRAGSENMCCVHAQYICSVGSSVCRVAIARCAVLSVHYEMFSMQCVV